MKRLSFASLTPLLLIPSLALATIFVQRPLQDEIKETPTIVHGTIGASYSDWGSDGSTKRLYTYYHLQVSETLKGEADKGPIMIREMGGEKDGIGMQVAGAAHFSQGEDVVVFLDGKSPDGSYDVHGLASGKFNLIRGAGGEECLDGIALAQPEADGFVHPDEDEQTQGAKGCSWTLTSLRQEIRNEGDAATTTSAPRPSAAPSTSPSRASISTPRFSGTQQAKQAAFQLQPSPTDERGTSGGGRLWILVLALGLAGLTALLLKS